MGWRQQLGSACQLGVVSLVSTLSFAIVIALLRRVMKTDAVGLPIFIVLGAFYQGLGSDSFLIDACLGAVAGLAIYAIFVRLGFAALLAMHFFSNWQYFVLTPSPSDWYFPQALLIVVVYALLSWVWFFHWSGWEARKVAQPRRFFLRRAGKVAASLSATRVFAVIMLFVGVVYSLLTLGQQVVSSPQFAAVVSSVAIVGGLLQIWLFVRISRSVVSSRTSAERPARRPGRGRGKSRDI